MRALILVLTIFLAGMPLVAQTVAPEALFSTSDRCVACHNGILSPSGEDLSIGASWSGSMMANAARDPYWQASVRRETLDHPQAAAAIENECSACHMPMTRFAAKASGAQGSVFAHLPIDAAAMPADLLAADGVSCSLCHQIGPQGLGEPSSFTAGFAVDPAPAPSRRLFGPFEIAAGHARIMDSATAFAPEAQPHLRTAEFCATCHTLHTHALDAAGNDAGRLPEQVPYLEWRHSSYAGTQTCQDCHMPLVEDGAPIASVMPVARDGARRHVFRGGNFVMPRIFALHAADLGVSATAAELTATAARTADHLRAKSAALSFGPAAVENGRLRVALTIENRAGHKLPTAYPSRRAWVHLTVRDRAGKAIFESGAFEPNGAIRGNDNDLDPARYEPHYRVIETEEQVQVYEPILVDADGAVTTGLIRAVRYAKDNRILPAGFDKATSEDDVAVRGEAASDPDFEAARDTIVYSVDVGASEGPFTVEAELWYQPIAFRWAKNVAAYQTAESARFGSYYDTIAGSSAMIIATAQVEWSGQ
jgi:hypothetical protein